MIFSPGLIFSSHNSGCAEQCFPLPENTPEESDGCRTPFKTRRKRRILLGFNPNFSPFSHLGTESLPSSGTPPYRIIVGFGIFWPELTERCPQRECWWEKPPSTPERPPPGLKAISAQKGEVYAQKRAELTTFLTFPGCESPGPWPPKPTLLDQNGQKEEKLRTERG